MIRFTPFPQRQPVPKNASKLDFTWFEYPLERFEKVVGDYLKFWEDFKERHDGFEPTGKRKKGEKGTVGLGAKRRVRP